MKSDVMYGLQEERKEDTMKNKVKDLRKLLGLSQEELAKKTGVTRQTISSIENGSTPSFETMEKLSDKLKKSVDEIFFEQL